MDYYKVVLTSSAEKEITRLRKDFITIIWDKIKQLSQEPRPMGSKKLKGMEQSYRLRFRDYRVIYRIDDKAKLIIVSAIIHRQKGY